jgi:hypothetical protein
MCRVDIDCVDAFDFAGRGWVTGEDEGCHESSLVEV